MRKSYRFGALALVILVALASFGVVAAQDKVTINWWHISTATDQAAYWQGLADKYTAAHPNVDIKITILENDAFKQKLVTVMQAGDPPDLLITPRVGQIGWFDFHRAADLIEFGAHAAERAIDSIQEAIDVLVPPGPGAVTAKLP